PLSALGQPATLLTYLNIGLHAYGTAQAANPAERYQADLNVTDAILAEAPEFAADLVAYRASLALQLASLQSPKSAPPAGKRTWRRAGEVVMGVVLLAFVEVIRRVWRRLKR